MADGGATPAVTGEGAPDPRTRVEPVPGFATRVLGCLDFGRPRSAPRAGATARAFARIHGRPARPRRTIGHDGSLQGPMPTRAASASRDPDASRPGQAGPIERPAPLARLLKPWKEMASLRDAKRQSWLVLCCPLSKLFPCLLGSHHSKSVLHGPSLPPIIMGVEEGVGPRR